MFRNAIVPLTEGQWRQDMGRAISVPDGYVKVNNIPYVIGDAARRWLIKERPEGVNRYRADYMGVAMAYAMFKAFGAHELNVDVVCTHPPRDVDHVSLIVDAVSNGGRPWVVTDGARTGHYTIASVNPIDEPIAGFFHFAFGLNGELRTRLASNRGQSLVIDVGNFTVDTAIVNPAGVIDPRSLRSTVTGYGKVVSTFEQMLRDNNREKFKGTKDIDEHKIFEALNTGIFRFGKTPIKCAAEAAQSLTVLANEVIDILNAIGGVMNYDVIVLDGGGCVPLAPYLVRAFPDGDFRFADKDPNQVQLSNAVGALKYFKMAKRAGYA